MLVRVGVGIAVVITTMSMGFITPGGAATTSNLVCDDGYYADLSAAQYLDLYSSSTDYGYCPVEGIFEARNGYMPGWASEPNVTNDYGKVAVRTDGQCSSPALPTGPYWDFELACLAHDYCYDLRGAGFSGTVGDFDCDWAFFSLMEAHCNDRIFFINCRQIRDAYFAGVSLPGVVTDPDPQPVALQALHSGKCADVTAGSTNFVPIVQWSCHYLPHQKYKFVPQGGGLFEIEASHTSDRCARVSSVDNDIDTDICSNLSSHRFRIQGSFLQNNYTLRPANNSNRCWDVPYSSQSNGTQISTYTCFETLNQRWNIS